MSTYTLDGRDNGTGELFTDRGLTAEQVSNAHANAERFGITVLNVFDESAPLMGFEEMVNAFKA